MEAQKEMIKKSKVGQRQRMAILPKYAGRNMILLENTVYNTMQSYCEEYSGGYWHYWELSNGGFFMSPESTDGPYSFSCAGNYYEGRVSPQAAGIIVCLAAFSALAWKTRNEAFTALFHDLREYALEQPEASEILKAID